jgi:CcmD family protein
MNPYLIAAYLVLWLLHMGYLWSLGSRTRTLREELERLEDLSTKTPRNHA